MTADNIVARWFAERGRLPASASDPTVALGEKLVAEIFADLHGDEFRFDHHLGKWFIWDGSRWRCDEIEGTLQRIFGVAREAARHAKSPRAASQMEKTSYALAVERAARGHSPVAVTSAVWDVDPLLLGTPGGTVDLRTGVLRKPDPADGITKQTSVTPAPTADCPQWLNFLGDTTGYDDNLTRFLQRMCGYCLTGDTCEHVLFFIYGSGGNGKSVFLNTMMSILGDYARRSGGETFTASKHDRHPEELAMLKGARMVSASETEEGRGWAERRVKEVTSADPITARFMRQNSFTYVPEFKLVVAGNHKPTLRNVDAAERRRFRIIPFERTPKKVDPYLEAKLRDEAPGILRWMIHGALDWRKHRLGAPAIVRGATNAYFEDQDAFGEWLEDSCKLGQAELEAVATLYGHWVAYCRRAGEDPGSKKRLSEMLVKRGFRLDRATIHGKQARVARGLSLLPHALTAS